MKLLDLDCLFTTRVARLAGWLLLLAIAILSLSPAPYRPVTPLGHNAEHILIHVLVGLAFAIGYAKRWWLLAPGLVAFVATIELAQLFVPGRHARLKDFLIDAVAACLGLGLAWIGQVVTSILSRPSGP